MWTDALLEDVQDRPVVDHDLSGRVLQIQPGSAQCNGGSCTNAWIAEITGHGGGPSPWMDMGQAYLQAIVGEGALGGTIPAPQEGDDSWAQTWSILATGLGVPQLSAAPRRASSRVQISELKPGQIAWLEAPWTTPVGGVADASGRLLLETWHQGEATIRSGDWQQAVQLEAGSWENFSRQGTPVEVHP